jgi:hypothetical protein
MKFENDAQRTAYGEVSKLLADLFDERSREDGHFYVRYGSTVLEIYVEPYGPEESAVIIMAYCVQDVALDEELTAGLLELNHQLPFGAFSLVGNDIFFSYSLFGSCLDRRGLMGAVAAVANVSDEYDDRIVAKYGGQTALEKVRGPFSGNDEDED